MAFRNLSNKRNFAAEMIFFDALQVLLDDAAHLLLNVTHLETGLALKDGLVLDRLLQGALESQEDGSDVTECIARALLAFSKERILEMAAAAQLCSEVSENQHVSSGVVEFDFESGDESCAEDSALAEGSEYAGRIGAATDEVASEGDSDCASGAALCDGALADACYSFSANVV